MSPEPKSRPLNLKSWQVRAALENRLGLVVVPMKPQPELIEDRELRRWRWKAFRWSTNAGAGYMLPAYCPMQPGDRLWVRETWYCEAWESLRVQTWEDVPADSVSISYSADAKQAAPFWRPSTTLPRWGSRLTFEATDIRVRRVQDIKIADAIAAGCAPEPGNREYSDDLALEVLEHIWDATHPKHPWFSNPWVWLVSVKRVEQEVGHAG